MESSRHRHRDRTRSRSRSPRRSHREERNSEDRDFRRRDRDRERHGDSRRHRSPEESRSHRHHHHHHSSSSRHHKHHRGSSRKHYDEPTKALPFNARQLSKHDLPTFKALFAHYLDLQKSIAISSLSETEVRGRWKSFVGKWNRGELAEGWYDPEMFHAHANDEIPAQQHEDTPSAANSPLPVEKADREYDRKDEDNNEEDDSDYGPPPPPPPGQHGSSSARPHGPGIPSRDDLTLRDELNAEESHAALLQHRWERKQHRLGEKALLEELVPRAEPGSRERKLEKKKEVNEKMKGFREKDTGVEEVNESELIGGDDTVEEYKRLLALRQSKKNERKSRREEEEMIRRAERQERVQAYKEREDRVIEELRKIAQERFGGGAAAQQ
ncbi:RNA helicase [Podospora australis]|uniref:RNA helicase n=1 Tax=Podospora australis TaxID=1536484 RepID=A0AAN6X290_9PEZI|nr:RNA helicase [Podospora australis]